MGLKHKNSNRVRVNLTSNSLQKMKEIRNKIKNNNKNRNLKKSKKLYKLKRMKMTGGLKCR